MKKPPTSNEVGMDLQTDPRGQILLKIQDMTTEVTDGFAVTDPKYVPLFEGFTAYDTGLDSTMVYLVLTKGKRLLLYGVEVPTVPKSMIFSRYESESLRYKASRFTCVRTEMDHADDISYILAHDTDDEILRLGLCGPLPDQTNEEFILGNALWLANPTIN